ncbi:hypothetical protein BJY00DRAFT_308526 [Aspergillus carlsbadensis]|nr:hypothetical protein BJY00DRAFT_308526 [Aspergillus carlsbadensis]
MSQSQSQSQAQDRGQAQFILGIGAKEVIPVEMAGNTALQARGQFTAEAMMLMKNPDAQLLLGAAQAAKNRRANAQKNEGRLFALRAVPVLQLVAHFHDKKAAQDTETMSLEIRTTTTKPGPPPSSIILAHNHPTLPKVEITPLGPGSPYKVTYRYEVKMSNTPKQAGSTAMQESKTTDNPPSPAATKGPSSTATKTAPTFHQLHQPALARPADSATQSAKSGVTALNVSSSAPAVNSQMRTKKRGAAPSITTTPRASGPIMSRTKSEATRDVSTRALADTDATTSSCKYDSRSTTASGNGSSARYQSADDHDCRWCDCPKLPLPPGLVPMAPPTGDGPKHFRPPVGAVERSIDARYHVVHTPPVSHSPADILPTDPRDEYECARVTRRRVLIKSKTVHDLSGLQWVHQVASWTESTSRDHNNNLHFIREGHNLEQILRLWRCELGQQQSEPIQ